VSSACSDVGGEGSMNCAELSTGAVKSAILLLRTEQGTEASGVADIGGAAAAYTVASR
jgi:hypothetical protein